ncbi:MAG: DUF1844 domain-containing protein [Candidatus Acidiferrales bacterium]
MPESKSESDTFAVVDKRRFTSEGDRRPGVESPAPPPHVPLPEPAPAPKAAPVAESEASRSARQSYERQANRRGERQADFESVVLSLSTLALQQLGLVEDPVAGRIPADLEAARHVIDMLAVVQEKTLGNLSPQEQQLLEQVLYELRMSFVALTSGQKPGAPKGKAGA